jgi:hypothetical protein
MRVGNKPAKKKKEKKNATNTCSKTKICSFEAISMFFDSWRGNRIKKNDNNLAKARDSLDKTLIHLSLELDNIILR